MLNKNKNKVFAFSTLIMLGFLSGNAFSATISDTVLQATQTHPSVVAERANLGISVQDVKESKSNFFPTLSVGGRAGRIHSDDDTTRGNTSDGGADQSWLGEGNISLNQKIWDGMSNYHLYKASQTRQEASSFDVESAMEVVAFRSITAHLNVMRTRELIKTALAFQGNVKAYQNHLKLLVKEGVIDEADLLLAEDLVMRAKTIYLDYENLRRSAEADYLEITGGMPETHMDLGEFDYQDRMPKNLEEAVLKGLEAHPVLMSATHRAQAVSSDIDAERGRIMPNLDAELSYLQKDQDDNLGGELETAQAMMRMSWDFSTGGAYFARVERSLKQKEEAVAREQETRRSLERNIRQKFSELDITSRQYEIFKKLERTNINVVSQFKSQFEGGKKTVLQLVNAQNKLFEAKTAKINSMYKRQLAEFGLLASMGYLCDVFGVTKKIAQK